MAAFIGGENLSVTPHPNRFAVCSGLGRKAGSTSGEDEGASVAAGATFVEQTTAFMRKIVERGVVLGAELQEAQKGAHVGPYGNTVLPKVQNNLHSAISELAAIAGVSVVPSQTQAQTGGSGSRAGKKAGVKK